MRKGTGMKKLISALIVSISFITLIFAGCSKMPEVIVIQGEKFTPPPSIAPIVTEEVVRDAEYFENIGFDLIENEKVGGIYIGMSREDSFQILGKPDNAGATPEQWGVDGRYHIIYSYGSTNSDFEFSSDKEDSGFMLIIANFGSKFPGKTMRDIGIGSTRDEVIAAYADEYNELQSIENNAKDKQKDKKKQRGTDILIMGDLSGGLCFFIDPGTNQVVSFLLGTTAAE